MKNAVFWDVTPCRSCEKRRFAGTYRPIIKVKRISELGTTVAVTFRSSLFRFTLMMEAIHSSEMLVLTRVTRRHIPEDRILHSHGRENLKSYIALTGWAL
jgi:hypothetical protein